jgi:hypothetical protein
VGIRQYCIITVLTGLAGTVSVSRAGFFLWLRGRCGVVCVLCSRAWYNFSAGCFLFLCSQTGVEWASSLGMRSVNGLGLLGLASEMGSRDGEKGVGKEREREKEGLCMRLL